MAFPGNLTTINVQGSWIKPDGTVAAGSVWFEPSVPLVDAGGDVIVAPVKVAATLDVNGAISVTLPATDDTDVSPTGWTYTVTERITGAPQRSYSIGVPVSSPGGILRLDDVASVASSTGTATLYRLLTELVNVVATSGAAQTIPEPAVQGVSDITLSANCTLTFPTLVAGKRLRVTLRQDGTGSRTVTWPSTVRWPSGTAPTLTTTAAKGDRLEFEAVGSVWVGQVLGQNYTMT
ncbi:hypothetical protein [Frankia sp. Cr1]|uniref:hypothetical protein n=1 Tax=Frankia sp. Cr1 TaxID=3073931 RepID=UPI002AD46911|nr:hypothetical protein [Frankia sp. Cr1]